MNLKELYETVQNRFVIVVLHRRISKLYDMKSFNHNVAAATIFPVISTSYVGGGSLFWSRLVLVLCPFDGLHPVRISSGHPPDLDFSSRYAMGIDMSIRVITLRRIGS